MDENDKKLTENGQLFKNQIHSVDYKSDDLNRVVIYDKTQESGLNNLNQFETNVKVRIMVWIFFTVIVTLIPFIIMAINYFSSGKGFNLNKLFGDGQLLLVSLSISAVVIGDYANNGYKNNFKRLMPFGCNFLCMITACIWYPYASGVEIKNHNIITIGSLILFICTILFSGLCILLMEGD